MAAGGVTRVVNRCEEAKENGRLDLSECQLTQVPDAIYLLLRGTKLLSCDLSNNLLKRVPAKLVTKFPDITELLLNDNKLTALPDELRGLHDLKVLDISGNSIENLPPVVFSFTKLQAINAENNSISTIDTCRLQELTELIDVNLQDNPLCPTTYRNLLEVKLWTVLLTPQDEELDAVD